MVTKFSSELLSQCEPKDFISDWSKGDSFLRISQLNSEFKTTCSHKKKIKYTKELERRKNSFESTTKKNRLGNSPLSFLTHLSQLFQHLNLHVQIKFQKGNLLKKFKDQPPSFFLIFFFYCFGMEGMERVLDLPVDFVKKICEKEKK